MTLSEDALLARLAARYAAPAWAFWAFLSKVRNATGWAITTRTADAVAMSLWPSRGIELHGFEIQSRRGDWARELADQAKGEDIGRFCDRWWLVVGDAAIVQPGEVPPTWGLLVPRGDGLAAKVEASPLPAQPLTKEFLAALLRRVAESQPGKAEIEAEVARRSRTIHDEAHAAADRAAAAAVEAVNRDLVALKEVVATFERESGVRLERWSGGNIAEAVRWIQESGWALKRRESLQKLEETAKEIHEAVARALAGEPTHTGGDVSKEPLA